MIWDMLFLFLFFFLLYNKGENPGIPGEKSKILCIAYISSFAS
jgi:hypothetical protein